MTTEELAAIKARFERYASSIDEFRIDDMAQLDFEDNAINDVEALIDEIERLRRENERLRREVEALRYETNADIELGRLVRDAFDTIANYGYGDIYLFRSIPDGGQGAQSEDVYTVGWRWDQMLDHTSDCKTIEDALRAGMKQAHDWFANQEGDDD